MVLKKADPKTVGRRLKELRGCRTKTGVVSEIGGIAYSSLCAYESGTRNPSPEVQEKLAKYYGVPRESIFNTRE